MSTEVAAAPPRRSQRVAMDMNASDGDEWKERIAVCESATADGRPKLLVRSYYRNSRTSERVWDEPPSGAGHVQHATPEMRTKADLQLQELTLTLEMIPDDVDAQEEDNTKKKKKKGGIFGRFRKKEKKQVDDSKDLNLQKAIARSMAQQHGAGYDDEPVVYFDPENPRAEDEAMAMAKALSMSESTGLTSSGTTLDMSEDEMLRKALEESRLDAHRNGVADVASIPDSFHRDFMVEEDRKMPIQPYYPY